MYYSLGYLKKYPYFKSSNHRINVLQSVLLLQHLSGYETVCVLHGFAVTAQSTARGWSGAAGVAADTFVLQVHQRYQGVPSRSIAVPNLRAVSISCVAGGGAVRGRRRYVTHRTHRETSTTILNSQQIKFNESDNIYQSKIIVTGIHAPIFKNKKKTNVECIIFFR